MNFDEDHDLPPDLVAERVAARDLYNAVEKRVAAHRLTTLTEEPKCPECQSGALRQKCFWEINPCPRFAVLDGYGGESKVRLRLEDISPDIAFVTVTHESGLLSFVVKVHVREQKAWMQILNGHRVPRGHPLFTMLRPLATESVTGDWDTFKKIRGHASIDWTEDRGFVNYAEHFVIDLGLPLAEFTLRLTDRRGNDKHG